MSSWDIKSLIDKCITCTSRSSTSTWNNPSSAATFGSKVFQMNLLSRRRANMFLQGLTADHPTLTTYFEGEVIGSKYSFTTRHPDWGSSERQDMLHWNKFVAWKPLAKAARSPGFSFKNFTEREHIFMRWKEYFLVPDHRVRSITGASFEGFYYICFNQKQGTFDGIYYHSKSERFVDRPSALQRTTESLLDSRFQHLTLHHRGRATGCMPAIELG